MSVALSEHLPLLATAPDGIQKLRELILQMAVMGKLVPQDPNDEPASELLNRIAKERGRLESEGIIKKTKPLMPVAEDEQPFSVPDGWAWVRVATLGNTQTGTTPSKSESSLFGNDVPFIKPGDISAHGVDYENEGLSHQGALDSGRLAEAGSILMVCIGTIGKCSVIDRRCSFNQQINSVTPFIDVSQFAFNVFRSSYFQREAWARSSSTTIAILNKGNWELIPVPLPPLPEQHRIVAKVDELMALCDRLEAEQSDAESAHARLVEALLGTLAQSTDAADLASNWQRIAEHFDTLFTTEGSVDALKKSILQLAVMGKLVPQDPTEGTAGDLVERINGVRETKAANGLTKKIKSLPLLHNDARPTYAPAHWVWVRLGAIIDLISGQHLTPDEYVDDLTATIPYLTGPAEFGPVFPMPTRSTNQTRAVSVLGDILLTVKGSGVGKINRVVQDRIAISRQLMAIRPVVVGSDFIELVLRSAERHFQAQTVGIAIPGIGREDVQMLSIGLPPLGEQKRIVAKVDELMVLCDRMKADLREARCQQSRLAETLIETALEAA